MNCLTERNVCIAKGAIDRYLKDAVHEEMTIGDILGEAYNIAFKALVESDVPMGDASLIAQHVVASTIKNK